MSADLIHKIVDGVAVGAALTESLDLQFAVAIDLLANIKKTMTDILISYFLGKVRRLGVDVS